MSTARGLKCRAKCPHRSELREERACICAPACSQLAFTHCNYNVLCVHWKAWAQVRCSCRAQGEGAAHRSQASTGFQKALKRHLLLMTWKRQDLLTPGIMHLLIFTGPFTSSACARSKFRTRSNQLEYLGCVFSSLYHLDELQQHSMPIIRSNSFLPSSHPFYGYPVLLITSIPGICWGFGENRPVKKYSSFVVMLLHANAWSRRQAGRIKRFLPYPHTPKKSTLILPKLASWKYLRRWWLAARMSICFQSHGWGWNAATFAVCRGASNVWDSTISPERQGEAHMLQ